MSIPISKYVLITSGVGGQAAVGARELIYRVFTTNPLAPTNGVLEFTTLADVLNYFGSASKEYSIAQKYLSWVSKRGRRPRKISYARYTPTAVPAQLSSIARLVSISQFQNVSNGSMHVTLDGASIDITGINLTSATSYADVATLLQTAISTALASCTVEFTNGRFVLSSSTIGASSTIAQVRNLEMPTGTYLGTMLGWDAVNYAVASNGADAEDITTALSRVADISNNFLTFDFVEPLSNPDKLLAAKFADASNVAFMYTTTVTATNIASLQPQVDGLNGVCLTLDDGSSINSYQPAAMIAAIDYTNVNANINAMFQQFPNDPVTVTDNVVATNMDRQKVNYNGQTQQAGSVLSFYQPGLLQGDIQAINVYANEAWLKDQFTVSFMNLLVALDALPANESGSSLARSVMQETIDNAIINGVFSKAKELTSVQKAYIQQVTGDESAWRTVYSQGYWLTVSVQQFVEGGVTKWKFVYTLLYSKGDTISKVEGTNILI